MKTDNPFAFCTETVRELLKPIHLELAGLLMDDNLEAIFENYDNWNGGIESYHLVFKIPVKLFTRLETDKLIDTLEKRLMGCYENAMRGEDESLVLTSVMIQPSADRMLTIGEKVDDSMWQRGYFRLFISHSSKFKKKASHLKICLRPYGIDAFVAHDDIQISKNWAIELENTLFTMDALAAILTDDFKSSEWCDQEVGIALGQKKLVIPIARNQEPYGIMGQIQGLMIQNQSLLVKEVAKRVWNIIINDKRTSTVYWEKLIDLLFIAENQTVALQKLELFQQCSNKQVIETLHKSYPATSVLRSEEVLKQANVLFQKWNLSLIPACENNFCVANEYDLPF